MDKLLMFRHDARPKLVSFCLPQELLLLRGAISIPVKFSFIFLALELSSSTLRSWGFHVSRHLFPILLETYFAHSSGTE